MRKRKTKAEEQEKIPNEVWWAHMVLNAGNPVGSFVYGELERIIKQYPKHFPWETKYNSIPEEVHKAYKLEVYGKDIDYLKMTLFDEVPIGKGLEEQIKEAENGAIKMPYTGECTKQDFIDFFNTLAENEKREQEEERRIINIWNKHYKKYNLSYKR